MNPAGTTGEARGIGQPVISEIGQLPARLHKNGLNPIFGAKTP
jgi:hypothetical protein